VARQTRSQRRARRQAQAQSQSAAQSGGAQSGGVAQRARSRQQQVRPSQQAPKSQAGAQKRDRGGARTFIGESWGELKKVEWPGQQQVIQATVVVLIACLVVGTFLYTADQIWKPVVKWLIGQ
jgi:preprotein translocase subunit SecE